MDYAQHIIIFGGTFDPPHLGHKNCVRLIRDAFPKAKILIVPAAVPAAGAGQVKSPKASFADRVKMCELTFLRCDSPIANCEISTVEETIAAPNYTIQTVTEIKKLNPSSRLSLAIGSDQFERFPTWHEPRKILALADLFVIDRPKAAPDDHERLLRKFCDTLNLTLAGDFANGRGTIRETSNSIMFLGSSQSEAESTKIRDLGKERAHQSSRWLCEDVVRYINERNLFT